MRVPSAARHMGRSIAGKSTTYKNKNKNNNQGQIKPHLTPSKQRNTAAAARAATLQRQDPHRAASRHAKSSQANRGQRVNTMRPGGVHTQWGAPAALSGKTQGQDHVLQFATASGVFACLFLISGAGLANLKNTVGSSKSEKNPTTYNVQGAVTLGTWLYVKTVTTAVLSLLSCLLRSYWVWSNYNGSSKLASYTALMVLDWVFGIVVMVVLLSTYIEHGFWWVGFVSLFVFTAASLRVIFDLVYAVLKRNREKKEGQGGEEGAAGGEGEEPGNVEEGTKEGTKEGEAMAHSDELPSAPPLVIPVHPGNGGNNNDSNHNDGNNHDGQHQNNPRHTTDFTHMEDIPVAPSSPVRSDRMMYQPPPTANPVGLRPGEVMGQEVFEGKWLRLPQLSSRNNIFQPPIPAIGDVKMHLKERQFDVVASGALDGVTRVYMHRRISAGCYLFGELVVSAGHDASAQCTLTTTLKIDESAMGNPHLGRIVDSMDLGVLFRF